jgi:copper transport protein
MRRSILLCGLLLLALPRVSFAHATPVEYIPAALSRVAAPPGEIRIKFSERPEEGASVVDVFAPDGSKVAATDVRQLPNDPYGIAVPFSATASGTYAVAWSVISADDGHFTKGAFSFSIGEPSVTTKPNAFDIDHTSSWSESLSIALEMLGQALMVGAVLLSLLGFGKHKNVCRIWGMIFVAGAALSVLSVTAYIFIQASALGRDSLIDALKIFLPTVAGRYAVARGAISILAVGMAFIPMPNTFRMWITGLLLVAFAVLRARVSHAAASTEFPALSVPVMAIHIVGKSAWVGSIIAFTLSLPRVAKLGLEFFVRACAELGMLIAGALAIGGATGAFVVWLHLKRFENILTTHWGMYFIALTGFAFLLVALRLYNQFVTLGAAKRLTSAHPSADTRATVNVAWMPLAVEAVIGVAVMVLSGALVITTPPLRSSLYQETVKSQGATVTLSEHPYEDDTLLLVFSDPSQPDGFSTTELSVFATQEDLDIGPLVITPEMRFPGGYAIKTTLLTPPGKWHIEANAVRASGYDLVGGFHLTIPDDVRGNESHRRSFNLFTIVMLIAGAVCALGAAGLFVHAWRIHRSFSGGSTDPVFSPDTRVVALAVATAAVMAGLFGWMLVHHAHGGYGSLCEKNGHVWRESLPMRAGFPSSSVAALGCTVQTEQGTSHFGDAREYLYFLSTSAPKQ